jgi:hypothetical protein
VSRLREASRARTGSGDIAGIEDDLSVVADTVERLPGGGKRRS